MPFIQRLQHAARSAAHSLMGCACAPFADPIPPAFQRRPLTITHRPPAPARVDFERIFHGSADQHMRRAVLLPDQEWIEYALARGADINGRIGSSGDTIVMQLLRHEPGNAEAYRCLSFLMEARDRQGRTVDLLLANDAGDNALHVLARQPDRHLARLALDSALHATNGRSIGDAQQALVSTNLDGLTPEQVARACGNTQALEALHHQHQLMLIEQQSGLQASRTRKLQSALAFVGGVYPD